MTNANAAFRSLYQRARSGTSILPPEAKGYVYLLVPGLFAKHYPTTFKAGLKRLGEECGLDVRAPPFPGFDTDQDVDSNARALRGLALETFRETGKQVIFVGHSSGVPEIANALSLYPELAAPVVGWVSINGTFWGTPVASRVEQSRWLRPIVHFGIRLLGGNPKAVTDVTLEKREAFVRKHPLPHYPSASLAGGLRHDGLVPTRNQIVPGSRSVVLDDLNHMNAVTPMRWLSPYDAGSLLETMVALTLEAIAEAYGVSLTA